MNKVLYGNEIAEESSAADVKGFLCKSSSGGYFFRIYESDGSFADYDLRHDDLEVTISSEAMASLYHRGADRILDHSSEVLGLARVAD